MAKISPFNVDGFDDLNSKLKKLPDRVKRTEVLAIQRKLSAPIQKAYAGNLPRKKGTLAASVAIKTVPSRKSGGNPSVVVRPGKRGRNDAFYKFMVIRKGDRPGSRKRGSRSGLNTVVTEARDRTLKSTSVVAAKEAEQRTAKLIQKKIDNLS